MKDIEQYIGYLREDHDYVLDQTRLSLSIALLKIYKKGLRGESITSRDLEVMTEEKIDQIPAPFHQTIGKFLSNIGQLDKEVEMGLDEYRRFNLPK